MSAKRVLVVDDDEVVLLLIKVFTQKLLPNYKVVTVNNSSAALGELQQQSFDLVLTDYDMPKMNGFDLAQAIREKNQEIPIVMMTGSNVYREFCACAEGTPVSGLLGKPFSLLQLKQILQQYGL